MSLAEIQQFFDVFAQEWNDHFSDERLQRLRHIFARTLAFLNGPILDLGCGTGVLLDVFNENLNSNPKQVVELDISLKMLQQIPHKRNPFPFAIFRVQGEGEQIPLKSQTMGTVMAFQVFPHFLHPDRVAREVLRILKPGGYFCILHLDDHHTLNALHRKLHPAVQNHQMPSAHRLEYLLTEHGFSSVLCTEQSDLYLVLVQKPQHI